MNQPHNGTPYLMALVLSGVAGILAFALLMVLGEFGFLAAAFLGILIAAVVFVVLLWGLSGGSTPAAGDLTPRDVNATSVGATTGAASGAVHGGAGASGTSAASHDSADTAEAGTQSDAVTHGDTAVGADDDASSAADAAKAAAEAKAAETARAAAEAEAAETAKAAAEAKAAETAKAAAEAEAAKAAAAQIAAADAEAAKAAADAKAQAASAAAVASEDYDGDGIEEGENEGTKPAMLSEAREGGPDNLKEIKGVGPAMEKLLHSLGVFHFDQVAVWTKDELAWVDANLKGFKGRASRDNWVEQAKILAAGGETEFSKRVEDGGVY